MTEYIIPETLDQAFEALSRKNARVMAGGTDLMIHLRPARTTLQGLPDLLVDITRLPEMHRLELNGESPYIGAAVTFHQLETDPGVATAFPVLAQAASTVGSVQIRQIATIGGNVANASPAADGMTALTALGARAEIASPSSVREILLEDLITGPNAIELNPNELILGFKLSPPPDSKRQSFQKVGRRRAVVIARMNAAVCLDPDLSDPRVVLGACFPSPRRLQDIEAFISSGNPGRELWDQAGALAADQFVNVCGWRSSAPYKVPAVTRVISRALETAWNSTGGIA
jgi:CO/xanthine dehydrogenase FAD-binding subunit